MSFFYLRHVWIFSYAQFTGTICIIFITLTLVVVVHFIYSDSLSGYLELHSKLLVSIFVN